MKTDFANNTKLSTDTEELKTPPWKLLHMLKEVLSLLS